MRIRKIRLPKQQYLLLISVAVMLTLIALVVTPWPKGPLASPVFLDRTGKVLFSELTDEGFRYPRNLTDWPSFLPQLLIVAEDENFYSHPGVDMRGVLRSIYLNLKAGKVVAGGSTITQQLAHRIFFKKQLGKKSIAQKGLESVVALGLDIVWSKDKILEEYLNRAYFGRLAYGVEAASLQYFGKSSFSLDLAEASTLLALLRLPSLSDPRDNLDLLKQRQKYILDRGVNTGVINTKEAILAYQEPLDFLAQPLPFFASSCLRSYLTQQTVGVLSTRNQSPRDLSSLKVETTLDYSFLQESDRLLKGNLNEIEEEAEVGNAAALAIEPSTGAILSYACNVFLSEKGSSVDLIQAQRQPGSAIKPITYLTALDQGWTLASSLQDSLQTFYTKRGEPFVPEDYDQRQRGEVTLREALASSLNIPAVQLLSEIGLDSFFGNYSRLLTRSK